MNRAWCEVIDWGESLGTGRHPYLQHEGVIAFAHRGGSEAWPENSLPAFQEAVDLGYRYLETDIQATRDGKLVIFHDDTLARLTGRSGTIGNLDYEEVRALRLQGREPLPLLEEILSSFPGIRFNIDIKTKDTTAPMLDLLRREPALLDRICLSSLSTPMLKFLRAEAGPSLCTSLGPWEIFLLRMAAWTGLGAGRLRRHFNVTCAQIPPQRYGLKLADKSFIELAHELGIEVHVWTINEAVEMERLIDLGVDGLMTDRAGLLKTILIGRGRWDGM